MDTRSITTIMRNHLENIEDAIKQNMESNHRNASMRSVRSLKVVIENDSHGWIEGLKSFWVMERGRKSGRVPKNFREIIRQWIIDKGITVRRIPYKTNRPHKYTEQERSLISASGAIAYKIMTTGTRLHRSKGFDDIFTSAINKEMEEMAKEITLAFAIEAERIQQTNKQ